MKIRGSFAAGLALIVVALPAFAGTCDLRCASVQEAAPRPGTEKIARGLTTDAASEASSCPLHAAGKSRPEPLPSPSRPCHGQNRGGAILLAASAPSSPAGSDLLTALEPSPAASLLRAEARLIFAGDSASGRWPRVSPLPSILRL